MFTCMKLEPHRGKPPPWPDLVSSQFYCLSHLSDLLSDIFDLLSKEYDVKLANQYQGMKATLQKSFQLLKAIAKGNSTVQSRLFHRLDFLLKVKGAEPEMAEALTEVKSVPLPSLFSGFLSICRPVCFSIAYIYFIYLHPSLLLHLSTSRSLPSTLLSLHFSASLSLCSSLLPLFLSSCLSTLLPLHSSASLSPSHSKTAHFRCSSLCLSTLLHLHCSTTLTHWPTHLLHLIL